MYPVLFQASARKAWNLKMRSQNVGCASLNSVLRDPIRRCLKILFKQG